MPKALRIIVRGRVQRVGFRLFTVREAAARNVTGFVRNTEHENEVEVVACGAGKDVDAFTARLRTGPPGARVTELTIHPVEPLPAYRGFDVR